jgi:hypothetical protein
MTSLQFAATYGPIAVKSLYKARVLKRILSSPGEGGFINSAIEGGKRASERMQKAITQRCGLNPVPERRRLSNFAPEIKDDDEKAFETVRIPTLWGFEIEGGGAAEGLIDFSGRFFTTSWASDWIMRGFEGVGNRLKNNEAPNQDDLILEDGEESMERCSVNFTHVVYTKDDSSDGKEADQASSVDLENGIVLDIIAPATPVLSKSRTWDYRLSPADNQWATPASLDQYTTIDPKHLVAYPEWWDISWALWA